MHRLTRRAACAALALAGAAPAFAAQNDLLPTDLIALPDRQLNLALYAAQQSMTGPWRDGQQQLAGEAAIRLTALRVVRHFSVGEQGRYTVAPVAILTAADASANATLAAVAGREASGVGDLRVGTSFWFHVDRENREYATATLLMTLPTGDYRSSQLLNIGENRIKTVLSLGWMKPLSQRWVLDLSPEVAVFGDNERYLGQRRLSQDVAYAMTATLRHRTTAAWHWYGSAQVNRGGATRVDGQAGTGAPDNTRLALGTLLFTGDGEQWQLRYARDVEASNGFRTDGELVLRWSQVFR